MSGKSCGYLTLERIKQIKNRAEEISDIISGLSLIELELDTSYDAIQIFFKRIEGSEDCLEKKIEPSRYCYIIFNAIIIALHKYIEIYEKHRSVLNINGFDLPKKLYQKLKELKISDMRHKVSAHIIDKDTKRVVNINEVRTIFISCIEKQQKSIQAFIDQIKAQPFIDNMTIIKIIDNIISHMYDEFKKGQDEFNRISKNN